MDKSQKIYVKALKKYNNGYIDKAIELCEKNISLNINNAASINLKGLLMYLKGDISVAQKLWKINFEVNKDKVSEKYLESSNEDIEKLKFYREAVLLIKKMKINTAITLLKKCSESDFNIININNYMAICYIKKGEYSKSLQLLDNVFKVDSENKIAKNSMKTLRNINLINEKSNIKKVIGILSISIFLIVLFLGGYLELKSRNTKIPYIRTNTSEIESESKKDKKVIIDSSSKSQNMIFDYSTIKSYIDDKDYNGIYNEVEKFKDTKLSTNDQVLLAKAKEALTSNGVDYFYKTGCNYLNNKDYKNAHEYFLRAFTYGSNSYIYPDILYMFANTLELSGNSEDAIKYYNQYNSSYSDGDYEETVLYRLALIYNDLDKEKARIYAQKLIDKYPSSIYDNSIINSIVGN